MSYAKAMALQAETAGLSTQGSCALSSYLKTAPKKFVHDFETPLFSTK